MKHLLALVLPLAVALPVSAAEWTPNAQHEFQQHCATKAPAGYEPNQIKTYCECASTEAAKSFNDQELTALAEGSTDAGLQERLNKVLHACMAKLHP